jgi:hypothetical protein
VLPGAMWLVGIFMYCKADEIYEISNFHNLVHFTQKVGGAGLNLPKFTFDI